MTTILAVLDHFRRTEHMLRRVAHFATAPFSDPAAPVLRHLALLESLTTPNHYHYDRHLVGREDVPERERLAAAKRLVTLRFGRPIPAPRWKAYKEEIRVAVRRRAESRGVGWGWKRMWRQLVAEAIVVAVQQGKYPLARVDLTVDGQRRTIAGPVTPLDLPALYYDQWLKNRIGDELLNDLVPDWRGQEQRAKERMQEQPLDTVPELELSVTDLDALVAQDASAGAERETIAAIDTATEAGQRLAELLTLASPRQRDIAILKAREMTDAEIAVALGMARSTVAVQWGRFKQKLDQIAV